MQFAHAGNQLEDVTGDLTGRSAYTLRQSLDSVKAGGIKGNSGNDPIYGCPL